MKLIFCLLFLFQIKNCNSETLSTTKIQPAEKIAMANMNNVPESYVINSIDQNAVGKKVEDKEKVKILKKVLKNSFQREVERPYMWDIFVSSNDSLLQFYPYKNFEINGVSFASYFVKINYEDGSYQGILLVDENSETPFNSMLVFEDLKSEENYHRYTEVKGDKIQVFLNGQNSKKDLQFQVKNGCFLDYFNTQAIDKKWGKKQKDYEYFLKGKTNNNLKNGYWIEKKYSIDYNKNIIEDGNYVNGIKDGEWNYSPEGPVDKVEVYQQGKVVKVYYP